MRKFIDQGASQRVIAAAVGRSIPTLRKLFAAELGLEKKSRAPVAPPVKITAQMQGDVALMAACNEPAARIAKAIGITEDELAKHFADDLETGAARYRLKVLNRLNTMAEGGTLGAANKLAALTAPPDGAAAQGSAGYVSKKATALADAKAATASGGKFAPRQPPRLAAVNGEAIPKDI